MSLTDVDLSYAFADAWSSRTWSHMGCRYAVTELLETEREYIRHLDHLITDYCQRLGEKDTPEVLKNKKDVIFANVKQIHKFHDE